MLPSGNDASVVLAEYVGGLYYLHEYSASFDFDVYNHSLLEDSINEIKNPC